MITVQIDKNFRNIELSQSKIKKLVRTICERFKLSNATVSIVIVDDIQMRKINSRFLNRKSTTDCLSFNLSDGLEFGSSRRRREPERGKTFELVVNGELAIKEADLRGHSGEAELALYITHGLLHNLGFDDRSQNQAKRMHKIEDEILQQFGYGVVYNKKKRI
jgi:probable rRNA maturation factor